MTTWLDHSPGGVLVLCRRCPSWREHRPSTVAGWAAAAEHARRVHGAKSPEARHAEKNLSARRTGRTSGQGGARE